MNERMNVYTRENGTKWQQWCKARYYATWEVIRSRQLPSSPLSLSVQRCATNFIRYYGQGKLNVLCEQITPSRRMRNERRQGSSSLTSAKSQPSSGRILSSFVPGHLMLQAFRAMSSA